MMLFFRGMNNNNKNFFSFQLRHYWIAEGNYMGVKFYRNFLYLWKIPRLKGFIGMLDFYTKLRFDISIFLTSGFSKIITILFRILPRRNTETLIIRLPWVFYLMIHISSSLLGVLKWANSLLISWLPVKPEVHQLNRSTPNK